MSKRVRRRRGTRAEHDEFTGADGEITVNTTDYRVHVHDGATAGGVTTAREDEVLHKDQNLSDVDSAATSRTNLGLGTADDVTFQSVTTSQDNWTATAEPTVNDDNTAGYVVGSRWYYAGGSPHVQWVCVDASTGAAEWVPVQERYESQTVELGGDFDSGQNIVCTLRGNVVTITSVGLLTHPSNSTVISAAVIPSQFRPSSTASNVYTYRGQTIDKADIAPSGELVLKYRSHSGGLADQTGTDSKVSVTYEIV